MTPMKFTGASPLSNDSDINFFNPGGTDSFVFNGTGNDDTIAVAPGEAGGTDIRNTLNGILFCALKSSMSPVRSCAVAMGTTHSIIPATSLSLWPTKGAILGERRADLHRLGRSRQLITVDFGAETVQEAGFAAVSSAAWKR